MIASVNIPHSSTHVYGTQARRAGTNRNSLVDTNNNNNSNNDAFSININTKINETETSIEQNKDYRTKGKKAADESLEKEKDAETGIQGLTRQIQALVNKVLSGNNENNKTEEEVNAQIAPYAGEIQNFTALVEKYKNEYGNAISQVNKFDEKINSDTENLNLLNTLKMKTIKTNGEFNSNQTLNNKSSFGTLTLSTHVK